MGFAWVFLGVAKARSTCKRGNDAIDQYRSLHPAQRESNSLVQVVAGIGKDPQ